MGREPAVVNDEITFADIGSIWAGILECKPHSREAKFQIEGYSPQFTSANLLHLVLINLFVYKNRASSLEKYQHLHSFLFLVTRIFLQIRKDQFVITSKSTRRGNQILVATTLSSPIAGGSSSQ